MAQKREETILFLMKTMKNKHIEDTMKNGRFCFSHPSIFEKWEDKNSARHDRWDGYSSIIAENLVYAPILSGDDEEEIYGEVKPLAEKAQLHLQSGAAQHTPICCFRMVEESEVEIDHKTKSISFSLGDIADRIKNEFGHDSYVLIHAPSFVERLHKRHSFLRGKVIYKDTMKIGEISTDEKFGELAEQIFRKDKRFEWQKEYRIALIPPTENSPIFVEIGSIEDIAISGKIADLRK